MTDKDFYDRIDKACSLFTSREAVVRYCHNIRMLKDTSTSTYLLIQAPHLPGLDPPHDSRCFRF